MVAEVRAQLGEPPWEREGRYRELGLDARSARVLSVAPWADLFDQVAPERGDSARRLASVLEKRIPFHARKNGGRKPRTAHEVPDPSRIALAVRSLERGEVRNEALPLILDRILADPDRSVEEVLDQFRPRPEDDEALEAAIAEAAERAVNLAVESPHAALRWAMGRVMRPFWGRVSPGDVQAKLQELLVPRPPQEEPR
jgi:Asp-tRNA(Asn)/Glu-tRNA(Gln) amidotransferase B subunit